MIRTLKVIFNKKVRWSYIILSNRWAVTIDKQSHIFNYFRLNYRVTK